MQSIDCPSLGTIRGHKQRCMLELIAAIQVAALSARFALHAMRCQSLRRIRGNLSHFKLAPS